LEAAVLALEEETVFEGTSYGAFTPRTGKVSNTAIMKDNQR
jgi:carbamoylphosphate synthase small subunit